MGGREGALRWGHRLAGLLLLGCATGCGATLSQLQTARPVEVGHVQVSAAVGVYAPLGAVGGAVARGLAQASKLAGSAVSGQPYQLTPQEGSDLLTAGIALAVLPPAVTTEFNARTGVVKNLDVGIRYNGTALRLDTKYRILHRGDPDDTPPSERRSIDVAVGLGVSRWFVSNPVTELLGLIDMDHFSRWDFELPVYVSQEVGDVLRVYGGAKYVYSRTELDQAFAQNVANVGTLAGADLSIPTVVHAHFVGATLGMMVGFRYAFVALELTPGWTFCRPYVLGERRDLGGFTVYPAVGLVLRF